MYNKVNTYKNMHIKKANNIKVTNIKEVNITFFYRFYNNLCVLQRP